MTIDWKSRAEKAEAQIAALQEAAGHRIAEYLGHATQGTWQPTEDGTHKVTIRSGGITGPVIFTHSEHAKDWHSRPLADTRVVVAGVRVLRALIDIEKAVKENNARISAEALRAAALILASLVSDLSVCAWLTGRADELERGL